MKSVAIDCGIESVCIKAHYAEVTITPRDGERPDRRMDGCIW